MLSEEKVRQLYDKTVEWFQNTHGKARARSYMTMRARQDAYRKVLELKTLIDVLPISFEAEFSDTVAYKFKDIIVIKEHETWKKGEDWIGTHKNVNFWYELENGYAVGMNENPSRGLSFPVKKMWCV